jgi:hypothetical protein
MSTVIIGLAPQGECAHAWRPSVAGARPPKDSAESHAPWATSEILDVHALLWC